MGDIIDFTKRKEMKILQNNVNLDDVTKELDDYMFSYLEDHNMYDVINDLLEDDKFHEELLTNSIRDGMDGRYKKMLGREAYKGLLVLSNAMQDDKLSPELEDFLLDLRLHAYDLVSIMGYIKEE